MRKLKAGNVASSSVKYKKGSYKKRSFSNKEFHLIRYSQIDEKIENMNLVRKLWLSPQQIGEISTSGIVQDLGYSLPKELRDCYFAHKHDRDCTFGTCMCGFDESKDE